MWKTCPWEPSALIETGLRQWLRCAGAALRDDVVIGMPSHAVDEAWHGFILCTARYAAFCDAAYGRFLHHHPEGGRRGRRPAADAMADQLSRTVIAWSLVAAPGEACVLWDLDARVGVERRGASRPTTWPPSTPTGRRGEGPPRRPGRPGAGLGGKARPAPSTPR